MPRKNDFTTEATTEMGYLIGATLSDGSIWMHLHSTRNVREFRLQFDQIDREMVEHINSCLAEITGRQYPIRDFRPKNDATQKRISYRLIAYGNQFIEWIAQETQMKSHLPSFWRIGSGGFRAALLAGLIDGDGYVSQRVTASGSPQWVIGCTSGDQWLDEVSELAASLNIATLPKHVNRTREGGSTIYEVRFRATDFAASSVNLIIHRKQQKIEALRAYLASSETAREAPHAG